MVKCLFSVKLFESAASNEENVTTAVEKLVFESCLSQYPPPHSKRGSTRSVTNSSPDKLIQTLHSTTHHTTTTTTTPHHTIPYHTPADYEIQQIINVIIVYVHLLFLHSFSHALSNVKKGIVVALNLTR